MKTIVFREVSSCGPPKKRWVAPSLVCSHTKNGTVSDGRKGPSYYLRGRQTDRANAQASHKSSGLSMLHDHTSTPDRGHGNKMWSIDSGLSRSIDISSTPWCCRIVVRSSFYSRSDRVRIRGLGSKVKRSCVCMDRRAETVHVLVFVVYLECTG